MTTFFISKSVLLAVTLGIAMFTDVSDNKIRNSVTIPAALAGLFFNTVESGAGGILLSLKGWLVPILLLFVLYSINVMGAGDIKLFAAIGAIMGLPFVIYSFLFSVYAGGGIAGWLLFREGRFAERMKSLYMYIRVILLTRRFYPYTARGDRSSKFIFTAAVVPGTLLNYIICLIKLKGGN